jgi:hypothetical protein
MAPVPNKSYRRLFGLSGLRLAFSLHTSSHMKTLALCILALAGSASARELDASPSFESPRTETSARPHDRTKDATVDAKYDVAFPTHDAAKSRAKGSI